MKIPGQLLAGMLGVIAVQFAAQAAEPSHRCAEQVSDAQRLACYDAAFGKPRPPIPASPAAAAATAPAATPTAPARPVEVPAPVVAVAKSEPPVPTKKEEAAKPTKFSSRIASLRRLATGRHELTLENGEVWAQLETDSQTHFRAGDTVTIRPASLGSFMLEPATGLPMRVRRLK